MWRFAPGVRALRALRRGALAGVQQTGANPAPALWTISSSGSPAARIVNPDGYDPYTRGTFWSRWLSRNPYFTSYRCRVYEGVLGEPIAAMRVANYILTDIAGPEDGQTKITAKDLFSLIEAKKSVAPSASNGRLIADITAAAATATLAPSGIGNLEYLASGHVAIGDEVIAYTRAADVLTLTTRGVFGTVAADHKTEDLVQLVLSYVTLLAKDIIYDLLLNYSAMNAPELPLADWTAATAALTNLYTARITKPTPVRDLIGELAEQAGLSVWPDVGSGQIKMAALRAAAPTATVDDSGWIVEDSLSVKRQVERRASEIWVYYGQIDPTKALDEKTNYHSRAVTLDLAAEGDQQYGSPAIREVFSRWIPQFGRGFALEVGSLLLAMFRDPPIEASFKLYASRAGALALARYCVLQTADVQDDTGAVRAVTMAATAIEHGENELEITAQQVTFGTVVSGSGERVIYIENNVYNLNLRTLHDSLYAVPVGTETVRFIVVAGFTVGSTSTATPAMDTGSWPAGVALKLDNPGRIQGKGGRGGNNITVILPGAAENGFPGGDALKATYAISVDNTGGKIWGGGGGGGATLGGVGGSGGAGTDPGAGGTYLGNPGTADAGGASYTGAPPDVGGAGGDPGLAGGTSSSGQTGGAAGKYINGNAFVTWVATGDRRGGVA